jgi:signal transduction histidine kinase
MIWFFTLAFPTLGEAGLISNDFIQNGYWGISFLKPYQLFGLENKTPIANACFWSLLFNAGIFTLVSFFTSPDIEELSQADIFINIEKYSEDPERNLLKRQASVPQLKRVLVRYLGCDKTRELLQEYSGKVEESSSKSENTATAEFINYVEKMLAGAFGSSSAKIILSSEITKEDIKPRQLISILDQTKKIMEYSTELERKTEQLEKASIELEEANEGLKRLDTLKAEFISTVTHELRTPITTIRSFSQILSTKRDLPEEKKQAFLEIILKECDRIRRLIDQVLEVERLESKTAQEESCCQVNTIVNNALDRLSPQIENKGIQLIVNLPEENHSVKLSEDKLLQVMLNLLSNATKFADSNQGEIDVNVSYIENRKSICVEVYNNGAAIPERYKDTIFDKFIQVKEGNLAKPEGSGLGLYITRKFIEQAGGSIDFTSGVEEGTCFFFFLPVINVRE